MAERIHAAKGYVGGGLADSGEYAKSYSKSREPEHYTHQREGTVLYTSEAKVKT